MIYFHLLHSSYLRRLRRVLKISAQGELFKLSKRLVRELSDVQWWPDNRPNIWPVIEVWLVIGALAR